MEIYTNPNFLFHQIGNYIYAEDKSAWPIKGLEKDDVGICMVWIASSDELKQTPVYNLITRPNQLYFLGNVNVEYHIRMYAAEKFISGTSAIINNIYWFDSLLWICNDNNPEDPEASSADWDLISVKDLSPLNYIPIKMDGYFEPVNSPPEGNFNTTKLADHSFEITWLGDGNVTEVALYDYRDRHITTTTDILNNTIEYLMKEDGAYTSVWTVDGIKNYVEIYDFTDAEKCFFELMKTTLCDCIGCEDCPGPEYIRALEFTNMYQTIFNKIYADRAVNLGMVSTETKRTGFVEAAGIAIKKLSIMVQDCTCSKD